MTADKPDPLDRIVREACEKRTNARIARLGIVAPWKHGDDCECPTIRAALEQAREECIEAEVQQRVKHATTIAQGEALARAAAEAERDAEKFNAATFLAEMDRRGAEIEWLNAELLLRYERDPEIEKMGAEIERLNEENKSLSNRVSLSKYVHEKTATENFALLSRARQAEAERDEARDKAIKHEPDCASKPAGCGHDARLPLLCDCGASGN